MDAIEHLDECKWTHPECYAGFSPDGDYVIYSKNRDSSIMEKTNFERIHTDLQICADTLQPPENDGKYDQGGDWVYDFRARCSMVGWIEYLLIREDAPDVLKKMAGEIICSIADYPVYDEDTYSESVWLAVHDFWENESLSERMYWCKDAEVSIFGARHDTMPDGVYDTLSQSEMFY